MAHKSFEIATYRYYFFSSRKIGKQYLNLQGTKGEVCNISFSEDLQTDLSKAKELANNFYSFYYYEDQLPLLLDMLRNEKPVFAIFDNNNGFNNSRISTSLEPVGEGEDLQ